MKPVRFEGINRTAAALLLFATLSPLASCTVFRGTTKTVNFVSTPEHVKVVKGRESEPKETPFSVDLKRKDVYYMTAAADGYSPQEIEP